LGIVCAIAGHPVSARAIKNAGMNFSRCTRCSADLVEADGRWGSPPTGYKVIWRKQPEPAELPPFPPAEIPIEPDDTILVLDNRTGADRRTARTARVLDSFRSVERRRGGERRKVLHKQQALRRD
jgi:hypothetical protein